MGVEQPSFTDLEYGNRRRVSRREQFLESMDETIPWDVWVGLIESFYYDEEQGRKPKPLQTGLDPGSWTQGWITTPFSA